MKSKLWDLFKKDKKTFILTVVAVVMLFLLVIGAAYAYFMAQSENGASSDMNLKTATVDSLSFNVGDPISIHATQQNFGPGAGDANGNTTVTATLLANNNTNETSARYNVFFVIEKNNFVYTTEDEKAELLLKVTDPEGNEVTNIEGLKYYPGKGFDITETTGSLFVAQQYEIIAAPEKTHTWNIEVTLINLDSDQNLNVSKEFLGFVKITTENDNLNSLPLIAESPNVDTSELDAKLVNQEISYADSLLSLRNPDRGWYRPVVVKLDNSVDMQAQCQQAIADGVYIIHLRVDIGQLSGNVNTDGIDKNFTNEQLQSLNTLLDTIRKNGLSVIIRFAYDYDGNTGKEPKSFDTIKNHIGQLSSLFNTNKDIISTVETGFLGPWGEMHTAGQYQTDNYYKTLIETLLDNTPSEMKVNVRKPYFYKIVVGSLNNSQNRIGIYNDGYFGSLTDLGTFDNGISRDDFVNWMNTQGQYTLYGGETPYIAENSSDEKYSDATYVLAEMPKTHTTYLNSQWYDGIINKWKTQYYTSTGAEYDGLTAYKYITDHMGYRLVVRNSQISSSVEKGAICAFNLNIENVGFGNIVKTQKASIILRKGNYYYETTLNLIANNIRGGETKSAKFYIYIPSDIDAGDWQVYLKISNEALDNYAIKFANTDMWNDETLANYIGKVTVLDVVANDGVKIKQAYSSTATEGDKKKIPGKTVPVKMNFHIVNGQTYYVEKTYNIELGTTIDFKNEEVLANLGITIPTGYTFDYAQCYAITNDWGGYNAITIPSETTASQYEFHVYIKQ